MDSFDERILSTLKDGKPISFIQLLNEAGFSHNTLRLHLKRLEAQGLVVKEKTFSYGRGRPEFAYLIPSSVRQQVSAALSDPSAEIVALPFSRIRHLCRFEKGDLLAVSKKRCETENCPQIPRRRE